MRVVERYEIKVRGWAAVVLEPSPLSPPPLGAVLRRDDGREWVIVGVETHAMPNPKPPYGLALANDDGPDVGDEVTLHEPSVCPCGRPATTRRLNHEGVEYTITDPCEACAAANRQRLDLLTADDPTPAELIRRLLEPKS